MYVWNTVRAADGRIEIVEGWDSLEALLEEIADSSRELPSNVWASYVTEYATGEVVIVALFGPELEMLVTVSDGRPLCYPVPEFYHQAGLGN